VSRVAETEYFNTIYMNFRLHRVKARALKTYGELTAFITSAVQLSGQVRDPTILTLDRTND
jgi:hypothetical protein